VVRYLVDYRMRAFSGITVVPRLFWDIKAEPWLVSQRYWSSPVAAFFVRYAPCPTPNIARTVPSTSGSDIVA